MARKSAQPQKPSVQPKICVLCPNPISGERLQANPNTELCAGCADKSCECGVKIPERRLVATKGTDVCIGCARIAENVGREQGRETVPARALEILYGQSSVGEMGREFAIHPLVSRSKQVTLG